MNARWQDTPAAVFLRWLADAITTNILMLLCSIPIVTIGASISAMYAVMFRRERDEGMVEVIKTFFISFKRNFLKATALELVLIVILGLTIGDFWYAANSEPPIRTLYVVVGTIVAAITLMLFILSFAQQSIYQNSIIGYLKNSMVLAMCAPWQLLLAAAAWILPWYLVYLEPEVLERFGVIHMMCGFSFPAWATAKLFYKVFGKTKQADEVPQ